ncbi:MAG TPA: hypothetical protein VGP47_06430, partial [Parachlamydiaceae bacterium]|nr:hypothetical protein [Parachlamydiaceae bacterium]
GLWTHAFATGSDGHWITMIAQKEDKEAIKWYVTDSWNNQQKHFTNHLNLLKPVLNGSMNEDWWESQYNNAIGDWLIQKSSWINKDGDVVKNADSLLNEKSREDYIGRIINAHSFMKKAAWYEGNLASKHQEDIAALRKFALCFQKAEEENHPERSQKLGSIAAELEKAML